MLDAASLVLCSGSLRPTPLVTRVEAAAAAGFAGISVYFDDYAALRAAGWRDDAIRTLFVEHGLAVAEFDGAMRWLPDDRRGPSAAEFVDAAAAIGARSLTVIEVDGRTVGRDLPMEVVADSFGEVCDLATGPSLLAHLEYFPFSGIADLGTAMEIHRIAGRANGGVMVDTWHHVRGPDHGRLDLPDSASVTAIQVSDPALEALADVRAEAMHARSMPGAVGSPSVEILRALRASGSAAPVGIEVFSDELHALDPFVAARRCADALRRLLELVSNT